MNYLSRVILLLGLAAGLAAAQDVDQDGDGLSDFQEIHKYATDPTRADSDSDGIPDGDWNERREFTYTVRSIVQVMRPVILGVGPDDGQDARILDEQPEYVELEVIHYPLNTAGKAIPTDPEWRRPRPELDRWRESTTTSNWDVSMQKALRAALLADGIDAGKLDDRTLVEKASAFLLRHARPYNGYTVFTTGFREGNPFVPSGLEAAIARGAAKGGRPVEEEWERELFARGMFTHRTRGTCSSTAIYLTGALRALGIPTRIVLCIPVVDANDDRERSWIASRLRHTTVRDVVQRGVERIVGSWASHTFNEVWVGGRWRRLNFDRLGQGNLDPEFLGLMTHVATFHDWADARMWETIGRRQGLAIYDDVFGGPNPYSCASLSDRLGPHAAFELPTPPRIPDVLTIDEVVWSDRSNAPASAANLPLSLLARIAEPGSFEELKAFTAAVDRRFAVVSDGHPSLGVSHGTGGIRIGKNERWIILPLGPADRDALRERVPYTLEPRNARESPRWSVRAGLVIRR